MEVPFDRFRYFGDIGSINFANRVHLDIFMALIVFIACFLHQVWKVAAVPENDKFQFTYFAHKINSFDTAPKNLLPSDSRLRSDRFALEQGDLSKSGSEKSNLEEKQRTEKKHRESRGDQFTSKWFNITGEITPTPWGDLEVYEYNGKYSDHRASVDNSDTIEEVDVKSIKFNPWQYQDLH